MGLTKYRIGELIEQTFEINSDLLFGEEDVRGMTITKQIIPTKANVIGTELNRFLIVNPDEFVYNPRTHGKKIGLGYNDTEDSFIISWNNSAFRIKPNGKELILSKYLYMHFNRAEWDREACYRSWGSSTEVFSWDALCEMELELPPLPIQQKFVDVYKAMLANQRSYERGLDDLKLTCDAYIDELRRNLLHTAIGEYIQQSDERNTFGIGVDAVRGLATSKEIITTKADLEGVGLSNYKVMRPNRIAYVSDTSRRGDKISLAMNNTDNIFLVSSISTVFSTNTEKILPSYLMMFFSQSEFDRYTRFHSWGSARETFGWEDMREVKIPIPDIMVQRDIVDIYNAFLTRREINEKLKSQIKDICPILIKGSLEEAKSA